MSHTLFNVRDCNPDEGKWVAKRLLDSPIVHSGLDQSIGDNIQGPSLIRAPDWVRNPLGQYYLYFADHKGRYIRLAYADSLTGPWHIHVPGSLHLEDSHFPTEPIQPPPGAQPTSSLPKKLLHSAGYEASAPHIASPDVHVNESDQKIYMYYHGLASYASQRTRFASSVDGLAFSAEEPLLCRTYLRVVPYKHAYLGILMPGIVFKMSHLRGPFEDGKQVFPNDARHHALLRNNDRLFIFWSEVGEAPEHIKVSVLDLGDEYPNEIRHLGGVLKPEVEWEGATEPNEPSVRSVAYGRVNQLRDPCIFVEDGRVYLLYAGGGESAIGIAELTWEPVV